MPCNNVTEHMYQAFSDTALIIELSKRFRKMTCNFISRIFIIRNVQSRNVEALCFNYGVYRYIPYDID